MSDSLSDGTILAAVLSGDTEQFGLIVVRYRTALWRAAKSRLTSDHAADDAVQETFLAAFKWLASYDSRFSFRAWLWTILLNQCRRQAGRVQRSRERFPIEESSAGGRIETLLGREASPPDALLSREQAERLHDLLHRLPETQADALRLRFFGDLKFQEIADVMQCSLGTAKNRVRAGLLQMAAWMGPDYALATVSLTRSSDGESS